MTVAEYPIGAAATVAELETEPYALLAALRAHEPVSWLPALDGWLVTRRDLALAVMRDARGFTVQDPRFTTAQVVGPSMLSLDGPEHGRHRSPFVAPLRLGEVRRRLAAGVQEETDRRLSALAPTGAAELRRDFAGPLAAAVVGRTLGLADTRTGEVLAWYDAIVAAVTDLTAGRPAGQEAEEAVGALGEALRPLRSILEGADGLTDAEIASNAAVVLFGGIETMEGMIGNALLHLLAHPRALELVRADPALVPDAVEESLRLEPAAAVIDRYATADARLGDARVRAGDLVRISITAANRDPAAFEDPDAYEPHRPNAGRHLAFASGPHVCIGMHLARLEAHVAVRAVLERLPGLRAAPGPPPVVRGLVFRKPAALDVVWDAA
jgi:cytochrome P450